MANYNKITQTKFDAVKMLQKGGASVKEISKYLDLSEGTVYYIRQAESLEEYQAIIESKRNPPKPQSEPPQVRQTVTIQATHYMQEEMRKTNELLTLISNKLAYIVDELCGTAQK